MLEALLEATKEPDFKGTLDNVQYTVSPREALNMIRTRVDMNAIETTGYDAFKSVCVMNVVWNWHFEGHSLLGYKTLDDQEPQRPG